MQLGEDMFGLMPLADSDETSGSPVVWHEICSNPEPITSWSIIPTVDSSIERC